MIIYIDILIAENFVVNLFLLVMTGNIIRVKKNYVSLMLAAGLSSIYTLCYVIPSTKFLTELPFKFIMPAVFLIVAYSKQKLWQYIKIYITFLALAFLLAGICFSFESSKFTLEHGLTMKYTSYKPIIIALLAVGLIVDRLITAIRDRLIMKEFIFPITIIQDDRKVNVMGFLDTGNELKEPATNLPVIIIEAKAAEFLTEQKKSFYIPYKVIDGSTGLLEGFIPDEIIMMKDNQKINIKAVVCITREELSRDKDYVALLSRGIL
ncbi:sigma-E processing peptidase SpoIIGA [Alloiococcus sp. CFN-8]|uniref:sigma-E processing peptidase SpoIIGA n=1 Tax=Alloiococcus sp. CFN-8 TaxID=3416081 RepID=UPI003CFB59AA